MPTQTKRPANFTQRDGVSLKEYTESRLAAEHDYFEKRIEALEKATCVATATMDRRLAGMNEFREAMSDMSSRMATRTEMQLRVDQLSVDISDLRKSRDIATGKASTTSVLITLALSLVGLAISLVNLLSG